MTLSEAADMILTLRARLARAEEAIRMGVCPVSWQGRPTVAECVDKGDCGCVYGTATINEVAQTRTAGS